MKTTEKAVLLSLVLLLTAAWGVAYEKFESTVDETFALSSGGAVSLENINGDVTIETWDRDEVRVHAVKTASSQELLDGLEVRVEASSSAVRIDTRYPSTRNEERDHERRERRHMKVEYTLTVPRSAMVDDIDLVNGNLLVVGVEGGVEAETVNGNIVAREGGGDALLSTVNGGIELYVDRLASSERVELETVNGTIDLYLSPSVSADIRAESVNGRLANDLGIDVKKGKYVGSSFRGSVGGGGSQVDLETVNGRISVHNW